MITPTAEQQGAVDAVLAKVRVKAMEVSLSGHAGTGKTTLINLIREELLDDGFGCVVVTPTNKAAAVLQSKGIPAATLYAIFFQLIENRNQKLYFRPNHEAPDSLPDGKLAFAEVIIVDEASMLSTWALGNLHRMCQTLVLVGDTDQLPPVNDRDCPRGHFCSRTHDATLTTVMRNEGDILALATVLRKSDDCRRLNVDAFYPPEELRFAEMVILDRPQFICWRNVVRKKINLRVREMLGFKGILPVQGDLVVCRNNYSDVLLNGTQAEVVDFEWEKGHRFAQVTLTLPGSRLIDAEVDMLRFFTDQLPAAVGRQAESLRETVIPAGEEDRGLELTYGYAITAHTAQGGEWPCVAVVDERAAVHFVAEKEFAENPRALPPKDACRRWAYTAVTRAQETLYIVDEKWTRY